MAGLKYNFQLAIRSRLVADGALVAIVDADDIRPQDSPYPAQYPAITLSVSGSRNGGVPDSLRGVLFVRMWYQGAKSYLNLDAIHDRVKVLLDTESDIWHLSASDDVVIDAIEESFASEILHEDRPVEETYSLHTNYRFLATVKA